MDGKIKEFSLLRYGSATHSINTDQRRISLEAVHVKNTRAMYKIKIPEDTGVALPGYWMLFAVNNEGVPSVAKTILIG
jgi:galactose oxidase